MTQPGRADNLPRMPSGIPGLDDSTGGGFVGNGISIVQVRPAVDGLVTAGHLAPSELALKKFIHDLQTPAASGGSSVFMLTGAGVVAAGSAVRHDARPAPDRRGA